MDMQKKTIIQLLRLFVGLLFLPAFLVRCASMMTPTGGPKDTLPPVITLMTPDNNTTQMKDRTKIYIEFNEFVQLKEQQKEFFTSPAMKKKPVLTLRGKGVAIQLRDTLLPNTTYALNFGSSIRDNNEGNPLYSMRYVFSTGTEIDSMICSGYTADSYKADSVPQSLIYFFPADSVTIPPDYDSTMFKHQPSVIARAEKNGIFIAQNLKPIPYYIYAIQDKNNNFTYEPAVDQVGFLEGTHNPLELPDFPIWYDSIRHYVSAEPQLYFRMFTDVTFRRQMLSQHARPLQHKAMLYFNAAHPTIEELRFDSIPSDRVIVDPQTIGRDTIALWFNLPSAELPDTIKGSITYLKHDTINVLHSVTEPLKLAWQKIESKEQQKEREKQEKERKKAEAAGEKYVNKEKNPFVYKLSLTEEINPELNLTAEFDYPLAKIDSAAILLTVTHEDKSINDLPVHFVRDTAKLLRWKIVAPWKKEGDYTLTIPAGALTDVAGFSNDSIVGKYKVMDPEKNALIKVTVKPKNNGAKYIVQLLDAGGALKQERHNIDSGLVQFNYVPAGEVKLRVIEDYNGNGKWDSGNLVERRQPERAEMYVNEKGESTFTVKTNWESEITIDMNVLFAPMTMESLSKMLEEREVQRLQRLHEQQ
ncbi:MAG: Ig-like domain-containing protein, partial [Alistipes sp.]